MKKKKWEKILKIVIAAILLFALLGTAGQKFGMKHIGVDFGDFAGDSDYDSGSDWDSGGSDWNWNSGGSDWSSSDNWRYSGDYDYPSGGYGNSSGGYDFWNVIENGAIFLIIVTVGLVIIYFHVRRQDKAKKRRRSISISQTPVLKSESLRMMSEYKSVDPNFDEEKMKSQISNLYVQMQNCWTKKDISSLRPYFSDAMFAQMDRQLQSYRDGNKTNYVERIAVLSVQLEGWRQTSGQDVIKALVRTRIVDYTLDDSTGEVISGSKTKEKFMTYRYTLTRTSGLKTDDANGMQTVTCPNCGANVNINESAKCPYCGSVLTVHKHGWVISNIQGISQRTQ